MSEEELPIPIVPEPKVNRWENFKRQIKFYITAVFLLAAIFSVTAFLFLVPFVIDPAYSLIMADLIEDPVTCYVFETSYRLGTSNCSWSSCREGCTKDLTECFHIHVRYTSEIEVNPNYTDQPLVLEGQKVIDYWHGLKWDESEARLFINIKGCIYPSVVLDCSKWGKIGGSRRRLLLKFSLG